MIKYEEPIRNGGAPITNYIIEYRHSMDLLWTLKGTSKGLEYTAYNMTGSKVQFRVRAENIVGVGEPSEGSDYVKFGD